MQCFHRARFLLHDIIAHNLYFLSHFIIFSLKKKTNCNSLFEEETRRRKNSNHLASSSLFVARFTLSHYLKCFAHYFYKCTIPNVQPLARCLPLDSNPPPRFGEVQWVQEGRGLLLLVRHLPPHRRHLQHLGVLRGGQVPRGGGVAPGYR